MDITDFIFSEKKTASPISGRNDLVDSFVSTNDNGSMPGFRYSYSKEDDYYFINPQPIFESVGEYYNDHEMSPLAGKKFEQFMEEYNDKGPVYKRVVRLSKYLHQRKGTGRFLDFGCRNGLLLYHNRDRYDLYGIEINEEERSCCETLGIKMAASLETFENQKFDLITAISVMEHLLDPFGFIVNLREMLSPDGVIFLKVPVIDGLLFDRKNLFSGNGLKVRIIYRFSA